MNTPNVTMLRDLVMIRPMPLALNKTADGIILPGDVDKMAPKRATVVASGPGTYDRSGNFVSNPIHAGDQILYMERDLIPTKVEGEEYFILQQQDVILKLGRVELENDSLPEMTDAAYHAETMRRKLIKWMTDAGMVRVQDMINPVEKFITIEEGETVVATAKSFLLTESSFEDPFEAPEGMKAFSMLKLNYVELPVRPVIDPTTYLPTGETSPAEIRVMVRLAFLPRADVTLG